jgi:hypothetical protein
LIKKYIKKWFNLYEIKDLKVGANCGCCGAWMPNEIIDKLVWAWSLCDKCVNEGEIK